MKEQLIQLILSRLNSEIDELKKEFNSSIQKVGVRFVSIDNLLPLDIATKIFEVLPSVNEMRLMDSFREKKYTSKKFDQFSPIISDITFAFQDTRVIDVIQKITGMVNQIPDPHLYAGGISAMSRGHFLGPHIDNSHDGTRQYYRTLNLLYYVNPEWSLQAGGNLELWDGNVAIKETIVSKFNRLVLMETNPWSWHSVSPVCSDKNRYCVSNYYFSATSPTGENYFNVTSFSAWPEQKMLRALSIIDNFARKNIRKIFPSGVGRKDIYRSTKNEK